MPPGVAVDHVTICDMKAAIALSDFGIASSAKRSCSVVKRVTAFAWLSTAVAALSWLAVMASTTPCEDRKISEKSVRMALPSV